MLTSRTTIDKDLLLVHVYGPNRDSPEFYDKMEEHVSEMGLWDIIMGGDWNLVLDPNTDYCNYKHVNNPLARDRVEDMISNLDLTDIWRDLKDLLGIGQLRYKKAVWILFDFSWFFLSLISESMVPCVEQTDIQYGYQSDHSMLVLKVLFGKEEMKRKTFWEFNSSLLKDGAYLKEINE